MGAHPLVSVMQCGPVLLLLLQGALVGLVLGKTKDLQPVQQGDCLEGWADASAVGLGCVLAHNQRGINKLEADIVCSGFGEGGRIIEIFNQEQMSFMQDYLGQVEEEGEFVWTVSGPANYTYWDVEFEEPYPDPDHERNCVGMQSEMFNLLWITYWCEDGYDFYDVCQLP